MGHGETAEQNGTSRRRRILNWPGFGSCAMSRLSVAVLVALVVGAGGLAVTQQEGSVAGRPDLTVATDERVTWGSVTLPVRVTAEGLVTQPGPERFERRVTTARGVRIRLATERFDDTLADSVTVVDDTIRAGSVSNGARETFAFELRIDTDLPPGRYRLPVIVSYNFTSFVGYEAIDEPTYNDRSVRQLRELTIVVVDRPNVVVEARDQELPRGTTGTYEVTIRNTGTEPARNVAVRLRGVGSTVTFVGGSGDNRVGFFVDSIPPGESVTITTLVRAPSNTLSQRTLVTATVGYARPDADGRETVRRRLGINVTRQPPRDDVVARSNAGSRSPWRPVTFAG